MIKLKDTYEKMCVWGKTRINYLMKRRKKNHEKETVQKSHEMYKKKIEEKNLLMK